MASYEFGRALALSPPLRERAVSIQRIIGADSSAVLKAQKLRDLTLDSDARPYLAAASGLVRVGGWLYVIADDENSLGIFPASGDSPGRRLRLFSDGLPEGGALAKPVKPDLEVLTHLPAAAFPPHGALLALGSCSTPARCRGVLVPLSGEGVPGAPQIVDLAPLCARLARELPTLNLEGAAVVGDALRLLHRGNGCSGGNASIDLDLQGLLAHFAGPAAAPVGFVRDIASHDLGSVAGVHFTFTDASPLPSGRLVFSAIAEDAPDAYADGPCVGAAIGLLDADGRVISMEPLEPLFKVEGVHAAVEAGRVSLLLVADGDDPQQAAPLLSAELDV